MENLVDIYTHKIASGVLAPDEDQKRAVERLATLFQSLVPSEKRRLLGGRAKSAAGARGVYMYGGVGRGKSMVMDLFFESAPLEAKNRVHFHAFMLGVHDFLHARRQERGKKGATGRIDSDLIACADKIAAESRLLCFDEFQVKDVADAMILGRLFTALFERGVAVVMTSNIAPDDLYKDGLQHDLFIPFIDILKERLDIIEFTGATDYRLQRIRDLKVYYCPHDAIAHQALEKIFLAVADGAEGTAAELSVKGRAIHIPRAAKEVAWFSFNELCDTEKSAVDYLELVKYFRVFIVENIPRLDDAQRNAAGRFITLIDTLYDHHAQIAVSAAEPPERLYAGTEHADAFARTVSRLFEMQSRKYKGSGG